MLKYIIGKLQYKLEVGMASIFEAYDSTMKEAFTGLKVFIWAIPLAIALSGQSLYNSFVGVIVSVMLLGFFVTIAHNVSTRNPHIVPGLNFVEMIFNAALALVCVIPYSVIGGLIFWASTLIQLPDTVGNNTLHVLAGLFGLAFPMTALAIFIRRLNFLEAFNIKKYAQGFMEIFLSMSFFITVKIAIVTAIIVGFLYYLFSLFVGFDNSFWTYLLSLLYVFYVLIGANYLAQISEEVYTFSENEEAKRKEQERINSIVAKHE